MGRVINLFDNSKYLENNKDIVLMQNLVNDINNDIGNIISSLNELYNIISSEDGKESSNTISIRNNINDLSLYKKELLGLDFSKYNNLLYKLHVMAYISHNDLLKIFHKVFAKLDVDEIDVAYLDKLVDLYINFMETTLNNKYLSDENHEDNMTTIKKFIKDESESSYIDSKREVYSKYLYNIAFTGFGENNLSKEEKEYLDYLIEDAINTFINYNYFDIRNYFLDVIDSSIEKNRTFRFKFIELNEENKKKIEEDIKSYKLYYETKEYIIKDYNMFTNEAVSIENRTKIGNIFYEILSNVIKKNNELNNFINDSMIDLSLKIINLLKENINPRSSLLEEALEYLRDDIEIDRIIRYISSLEEYVSKNNIKFDFDTEVGINFMFTGSLVGHISNDSIKFNFDKEWNNAKSNSISDKLYNYVRKEIFNGNDKEFYSNLKYRNKLNNMIIYIANNPNYVNHTYNNSRLIPDFNIALNLLKGGMILENKARELGLEDILNDLEDINYKDYYYTSNYLTLLNDIINDPDILEKYNDMKKELSKKRKKNR